jgi:hypothetical protein
MKRLRPIWIPAPPLPTIGANVSRNVGATAAFSGVRRPRLSVVVGGRSDARKGRSGGEGDQEVQEPPPLLTPLERWMFALLNLVFGIILLLLAAALLIAVVKFIFFT